MSTAVASGIAALISDYFSNGEIWTKFCNITHVNCKAFEPSGLLIKLVMLHSMTESALPENLYKKVNFQLRL